MFAGIALIDNRSLPVEVIVPSVTLIIALSALYNVNTPLLPAETVATPFVKVIVVEFPKETLVPVLSFIVAAFTGLIDEFAPENVSTLSPV